MINATISMLGCRGTDKITGESGIISSVCFDLYGCAQVCLERGVDKDGKRLDAYWYDVSRIELLLDDRVMPVPTAFLPDSDALPQTYDHGPADKPSPRR